MNKSELVQMVVQKAGISAPQAEKAIEVVLSQLQAHLPAPVASQLGSVLEGGAPDTSSIAKGVSSIFGR